MLFTWPCWVLVVAFGIFYPHCSVWTLSCSLWDLVPWPGIKPRLPVLGVQNLSPWTTREVLVPTSFHHSHVITFWNIFKLGKYYGHVMSLAFSLLKMKMSTVMKMMRVMILIIAIYGDPTLCWALCKICLTCTEVPVGVKLVTWVLSASLNRWGLWGLERLCNLHNAYKKMMYLELKSTHPTLYSGF